MRVSGTIALAGMLLPMLLGASASTASADPLSMTFTEARADVGVQLSVANDEDALLRPPDTAPFDAQIDPGNGFITGGVLGVPAFSTFITDPVEADVTVDFEIGIVTGSYQQATGALMLSGTAGGTLTSEGKECTISTTPSPLTLTTAGSTGGATPLAGAPFTAGLAGAGAIAGQWTDMHATPVDPDPGGDTVFCGDVDEQIGGPGGIWLEQEGDGTPTSPSDGDGDESEGVPTPPPSAPGLRRRPARACVVPRLAGKRPARARRVLRRARCRPGRAWMRPGLRRRLRRHPGLRRRLVVKASRPRAGVKRPAGSRVHLRLGLRARKAHRERSPRRS